MTKERVITAPKTLTLLFLLSLLAVVFFTLPTVRLLASSSNPPRSSLPPPSLKVFVAELPRSLNYGLLEQYWSLRGPDSRIGTDPDADLRAEAPRTRYPESPLIKQYSAEYWLLGDLETPRGDRGEGSVAERVRWWEEADVIFVPFFATLSAEMELGWGERKRGFQNKEGNGDYARQREVVDRVKATGAWRRSGGRDHVFVLTDPVAMWHVRREIAESILLVVDFGGWFKLDSKSSGNSSEMIQHTQVSLLKDVIVPYTHLLPKLSFSKDKERSTLLYFKGEKHRHRGGQVREKLWDLLADEPDVIMEEGFPDASGREQSIRGMRSSQFCLHPAGDTPTSCRLFDAVVSLCIPVIVSDAIELPFEGMIDYSEFSVFISVSNALQPGWLANHLRGISMERRAQYRANMARARRAFEFDNGSPSGIGPIPIDGAVNHIWMKIRQKIPMIREAIIREKRKPQGVLIPLRCHCT